MFKTKVLNSIGIIKLLSYITKPDKRSVFSFWRDYRTLAFMQEKKKVSFQWAFKEYIWPRRKIVSIGLILIIIRSLSGLVIPYASKALIDEVIPSKDIDALTFLLIL